MFLQCGKYTSLWKRVFQFLEDNAFAFDQSAILLFEEVDSHDSARVRLMCIVREGEDYFAFLLLLDTFTDKIIDMIVDVSRCLFKLELVPLYARKAAHIALATRN